MKKFRNIRALVIECVVMESSVVAYLTAFLSNSWRKNWNSRRKQLASRLVQIPSLPRNPLFPRRRKDLLLVVLYVLLGGLSRIVRPPRGECLGPSCVSIMLCQPGAFALRRSSFSSPIPSLLPLLNLVAMLSCRMCWGQIDRTRAWAEAAGISKTGIGFPHTKSSSKWGKKSQDFSLEFTLKANLDTKHLIP